MKRKRVEERVFGVGKGHVETGCIDINRKPTQVPRPSAALLLMETTTCRMRRRTMPLRGGQPKAMLVMSAPLGMVPVVAGGGGVDRRKTRFSPARWSASVSTSHIEAISPADKGSRRRFPWVFGLGSPGGCSALRRSGRPHPRPWTFRRRQISPRQPGRGPTAAARKRLPPYWRFWTPNGGTPIVRSK